MELMDAIAETEEEMTFLNTRLEEMETNIEIMQEELDSLKNTDKKMPLDCGTSGS